MITKKFPGNVTHEDFTSLQEFITYIKTREPNKAHAEENYYKTLGWKYFESVCNSEDFTGTKTWEDAERLLANGYPEGAQKIMEGQSKLLATSGVKVRREVAMVGGQAHVPNAIIGLPKSMIRTIKQPMPQRTISIFYDCGASCSVDQDDLATAGANVYALIKHIENKGMRVQLRMFRGMTSDNSLSKVNIVTVKVKDYKQPINPLLVSYPLTHPSFFRRHLFRYMEVSDATDSKKYASGGCYTLRRKKANLPAYLRSTGILGKDEVYIDCESAMNCYTIDQMCRLANIA